MDFPCLLNSSNEENYKMNKDVSDDKESVKKSCSARIFDKEVNVTNRSAENCHEPLEALHGARIMATESAREKEQLTIEKITHLETVINAKGKEIVFLKETLFRKDKEISDLKEKLSQLQQSCQRNQFAPAQQMATMDEKLQEARKNIDELKGGKNFNVMKNKTKVEESQSGLQFFNGKAYFDHQPSWFDTLSNNSGCLEVENFPVSAKDLEALKSNSKPSTEAAKDCGGLKCRLPRAPEDGFVRVEMKKENSLLPRGEESKMITGFVGQRINSFSKKAKRLERPAQSPVDTFERPEVDNSSPPVKSSHAAFHNTTQSYGERINPVQLSGVRSEITDSSGNRVNPFSKRAIGITEPSHILTARFVEAQTVRNSATIFSNDAVFKNTVFNITTQSSGGRINPFSKKAKALERPIPDCTAANIEGTEVEKITPPVQPKGVPSNNITDSSGNEVNSFSKRTKGITRPPPAVDFAKVQTVRNSPAVLSNDAALKITASSCEINPFSKKAKGSPYSQHRPIPSMSIVPGGSQVVSISPQTYQCKSQTAQQIGQGFLSRTFNKWFGSYC